MILIRRALAATIVVALTSLSAAPAMAVPVSGPAMPNAVATRVAPPLAAPSLKAQIVPRRLVVGLDAKRVARTRATAAADSLGATVKTNVGTSRFVTVSVPPSRSASTVARSLAKLPGVRYVQPEHVVHAEYTPSDPDYPTQWGLPAIGATSAWDVTMGSPDVVVAVVDTGINSSNPDLAGQVLTADGVNFVDPTYDASDDNGHGTHVAGIIAASMDDGIGGTGLAPGCRLMPVKVLDGTGSGTDAQVAAGIDWAVDHGAKVINMSLGGSGTSAVLDDAAAYAEGNDVTLVAAAGNDGAYETDIYPAAAPGVVAVGATGRDDDIAPFSNWGPYVDVAAPGVGILSTWNDGGMRTESGTSMATPFVSAAIALVRSEFGLSSAQAIARLEATAKDLGGAGRDDHYGYGRIDVSMALRAANIPMTRVAGSDRYDTAARASASAFAVGSTPNVVLASGSSFADALSASGLCGALGSPLLLTQPSGLPQPTLAELARLTSGRANRTVYVVGGTGAVSPTVDGQLQSAGYTVVRLSGADRYATCSRVASRVKSVLGSSFSGTALVARGDTYPDALAAGPLAYEAKMPVLLTRPDSLPSATAAAIRDLGVSNVVLAGGTGAVSDAVGAAVRSLGAATVREAGSDRYGTASALAGYATARGWGNASYVAMATGTGFADALAGGATAGVKGGVLVLTRPSSLPEATSTFLAAHRAQIHQIALLGGTGAVSDAVLEPIVAAMR